MKPFEELNERLSDFERGYALAYQKRLYVIGDIRQLGFNGYDLERMLRLYQTRIDNIIASGSENYNKNACHQHDVWEDTDGEQCAIPLEYPEPLTAKEKEDEQPILENEIQQYRAGINTLLKELNYESNIHSIASKVIQEINLPESFSLKDLIKNFSPTLTTKQAAYFLFYLRANNIIPNYSNKSLGKISEFFLGRSGNTVRDAIGTMEYTVSDNDYEELKELKRHLEKVIDAIEERIK
jgi:hypothetical protein